MRRLVARPIPGVLSTGGNGSALVDADAPALLWLVGAASEQEVAVVSALDASGGGAANAAKLRWLEAGLPEGLEVLGLLCRDAAAQGGGAPSLPAEPVPPAWRQRLRLLAARDEDGALVAWAPPFGPQADRLGPWVTEAWSPLVARGRLSISVAAATREEAARQLAEVAAGLEASLRFRLPGWTVAPTLAEIVAKPPPPPRLAGDAALCVDVLAEACGAGGPTNFAVLGAQAPQTFELDFAACLRPEADSPEVARSLLAAARRQLAAVHGEDKGGAAAAGVAFRCFAPPGLGHPISLPGTEDRAAREAFHQLLRLPGAPLLLPECAVPWGAEAHPRATGKLVNPHTGCGERPGWWKGSAESTRTAFVRGLYEYSHYMQDHTDDNGWGCAYRSLQTCVSWYRMQFYSSKDVPSITEIQKLLKRIDEANKDIVIGSKKWIGTVEGMYLLQDYLGVDCRMMYCQDAADMASQVPQMLQHLETEGTPIMMGAGQYAYTLIGLCFDTASGEVGFLIADPHYTGADNLKNILQKGWVGWKNLEFFEKSTEGGGFINCCLPSAPRGPEHL